jgi:hypothetical protein
MAANKKPRKAHRPKPASIPVTIRHGAEDDTDMQLIPHAEMMKLRSGLADSETWHCLVARCNLGVVLANRHHPQEAIDAMSASLDALRAIVIRHNKLDRYGATGDELAAIGRGLQLVDEMQMIATRRELRAALVEVYKVATYPEKEAA